MLAVSGGLDSMVLLDAAARVAFGRIAAVATFDHASGTHSAKAAAFVSAEAARRGLRAVSGRTEGVAANEAAWRTARWGFLWAVARDLDAAVTTAHTEDDQVETVLMRAMRGAGARGLAGLYAPSDVVRPFLGVRRAIIESYATTRGVRWSADPTNDDRRYFRNRVRHDLLPALLRVRPGLDRALLSVARRAATLRAETEAVAAALVNHAKGMRHDRLSVSVAIADLAGYDARSLAVIWPAIAAHVGVALDRRGTRRVAAFTISRGRVGASMQLSGGWEVVRDRHRLTLKRAREAAPAAVDLPLAGGLRWGRWSFVRDARRGAEGPWQAKLPADKPLVVRAWKAGDRMSGTRGTPRRVKRFFGDAGIIGPDRTGWPVVLAGEEIVWIPGVGHCASVAGPTETPGLVYSCELNYR